MRKLKVVGGFLHPDEKGELTIPPAQTLQASIKNNNDWVEIPCVKTRKRDINTER